MNSVRIAVVIKALLLVATLQSSCNSQVKPSSQSSEVNAVSRQSPSDEDILKEVETFASSDATASAKAWKILDSYRQQNLVNNLIRLYASTSSDDYHRVLIAFTFCKLNYEYATNRGIVLSALTKQSPFKRFYGDWAASLVHRLLLGGDKEVLANLFTAAEWSDGAMSEELSGAYSDAIRNDPQTFLRSLASQSENTRRQVYALLTDNSLTKDESERVKTFLKSVPPASELHRTAQEAIKALEGAR
jgi:hypothetical protein